MTSVRLYCFEQLDRMCVCFCVCVCVCDLSSISKGNRPRAQRDIEICITLQTLPLVAINNEPVELEM
jgi:hypothetical protein